MKKGLILCLALVMAFAMAATAKKIDPRTNLMTKDGDSPVVKSSGTKLPTVGVIVSGTGYADAWRATAGMTGKSIVVDDAGTNIAIGFGVTAAPCNLVLGYSNDGGATWGTQTIFTGTSAAQTRIYNGLALDAAGLPYMVWQDRGANSIQWDVDEGGIGGGAWRGVDTLAKPDSISWYIPALAISGTKMIMSSFANDVDPYPGDNSIYMALSNNLGSTWPTPRWNNWGYNEVCGQGAAVDEPDWLISATGDTVVAFMDVVVDTALYRIEGAYAGFGPGYKTSFDGGATWNAMEHFGTPPQYWYSGWWYMYDGAWIDGRPYFLYAWQDGSWNGNGLFIYFPTTAGDYSAWTIQRISDIPGNLAGFTDGDLNGSGANFPCLSHDAAGNIYATYNDYPKNTMNYEIFGVASTDGGVTWLNPVQLTTQNGQFDGNYYLEAAEHASGDKIHMMFHDAGPAYTNIYYWSVPTATILAGTVRADEITLAPELCGADESGWGGPIDAVMDTLLFRDGDTLTTYWAPKVALNGTYRMQLSTDSTFAAPEIDTLIADSVNYISLGTGLSDTNAIWYWRVQSDINSGGTQSPWSAIYDFLYRYQLNTPVLNLVLQAPNDTSITLFWLKSLNSAVVDSYFVYRRVNAAGTYTLFASMDSAAVNDTFKYYDSWSLPHSPADTFYYRMQAKATVVATSSDYSNVVSCVVDTIIKGVAGTPVATTVISKFSLNQSRPNPTNRMAELSFTLPRSGNYSLKIYNIAGQVIRTLDSKGNAGPNTVTWNGQDNSGRKVANGVYLYNLQAFGNSATKKLVVVR